jgi:pyridoxal phosphate enzyme (YggS family)
MPETPPPAANLARLRNRIAQVAAGAGRDPSGICLIGVSKVHGPERILPLIEAGLADFGENRVQEAQAKWPPLRQQFPLLRLHLVGPLQTNKLRDALGLFDVIHSLDRPKLARKLAEARDGGSVLPDLFIQVNTGEEPQKAGVVPQETGAFVRLCRDELHLPVIGLMGLPPVDEEPSLHFALLAKLARRNGLGALSMGMSDDFETAIALGATHIRVGTALFGSRETEAAPPAGG